MGRIVAVVNLTLDGVMQAPGRADEDTRGGFTGGGWAHRYADPVQGRVVGAHMAAHAHSALLFGRRTYQDFHGFWPHQTDSPFTEVLDKAEKFVASRTLTAPLPWQNSVLLGGDAVSAVRTLRAHGSEVLVTDGPYAESKEHIGGFTVLEAADLDEALDWGKRMAVVIGLPIEVRPIQDR
ncbi:hypothetical protein GPX89_06860 [Nocardia sp. ET3-3]|uniref:YCII-related domain-containing protein n=1 Tax=Nocardia terrae TaxID=2675851 RepID=A0A7K1URI9_9NOCA|nr:YciI family protein [Nocardia terrae]MVU76965.1 hypothetical protein [Nocardia terrae]